MDALTPAIVFPAERVPDGAVTAPHHLLWPLLLALVPIFMVWDRYPDRDPWLLLAALLAAMFGFVSVWPFYPPLGAALTLLALAVLWVRAAYHVTREVQGRGLWRLAPLVAILVCASLALDDGLDHALTWWPSVPDLLWDRVIYPLLPST